MKNNLLKEVEVLRESGSKGFAVGPERELLKAMLNDAVYDYLTYQGQTSKNAKSLFLSAESWIFSKVHDYAFSFQSVCDGLGLDTDYLRRGIKNAILEGREVIRVRHAA